MAENGSLYIVSTPIGNLEDITFRAVKILKQVDLIAAEDTRHTGILLKHYNIDNKMTSYHDFNKEQKVPKLIKMLKLGKQVAVVSDAGTPGISDPAFRIIRAACENNIKIIPIPGPSAVICALAISGLPTDKFIFEGYLPNKSTARRKRLALLKGEERTVVFYESPHRVLKTLKDIEEIIGDVQCVLCREMTKKFEEIIRGMVSYLQKSINLKQRIRGEIVLVINQKNNLIW